ncbi:MAG TPA: molybdopterin-dependent oxidoreductase, partial [Burkholderiaceae bacterium]|nr:molybdopterin-dependent oxidoreductase [Burkholderiaceae bacterium]
MLIRRAAAGRPLPSDITPERLWRRRREVLRAAAAGAAWFCTGDAAAADPPRGAPLARRPGPFGTMDKSTSLKDVTSYNNFYEFGTEKDDPARNAGTLKPRPWTVAVEGLVNKPRQFGIEELLSLAPLEERIYRMRCVEGWSMVIPWVG